MTNFSGLFQMDDQLQKKLERIAEIMRKSSETK